MHPEALILRRCYPVPATFADLRAAADIVGISPWPSTRRMEHIDGNVYRPQAKAGRARWSAALKQVTGALDEVYAVVDGREVRVAMVTDADRNGSSGWSGYNLRDLFEVADEQGYWACPHEVRLDLSPRPVSHGEVAQAVLVGQEALERGGVVRT